MALTCDQIKAALESLRTVNGECEKDAKDIVRRLLGNNFENVTGTRCRSVEAALVAIRQEYDNHELVLFWPEQNGNGHKHVYFIYSIDPLSSFTFFAPDKIPGPVQLDWLDENRTRQKLSASIASAAHGNYVDVNKIQG